jgi:hypothetical protein
MDGKATKKSKLETMLPAGTSATVDFNPVADRLRIIGSDGTSLRVNVDDGEAIKDGSMPTPTPMPARARRRRSWPAPTPIRSKARRRRRCRAQCWN